MAAFAFPVSRRQTTIRDRREGPTPPKLQLYEPRK
jgi:hypothetical protein